MNNVKIALIDDNKTVLMVNEVMLKKEGFITSSDKIDKFFDVNEFNNKTDYAYQYDIIVCDYDLGIDSINGLEFLKNLKNLGYPGECILLTGDDSITMKTKMLLLPNISYIIKNNEKNNENHIFQLGRLIEKIKTKLFSL